MAVRPIDANAMLNGLRPVSFEAEHSAVLLSDVSKMMREWVERQPTLTPPNEWVSVETEMPKEPGHYLVVLDRKAPEDLGGDKKMVRIMRFRLDGKFQYPAHFPAWINDEIEENVTHWMPLPEAPDSRPPEGEG